MRVLVVDDEPQLRRALERALKLEGYEVELAADGEQALGSIASAPIGRHRPRRADAEARRPGGRAASCGPAATARRS